MSTVLPNHFSIHSILYSVAIFQTIETFKNNLKILRNNIFNLKIPHTIIVSLKPSMRFSKVSSIVFITLIIIHFRRRIQNQGKLGACYLIIVTKRIV